MKVFGCLAFASNPKMDTDKFKARGIPCVFLGFPTTQKGYKLMDIQTRAIFVSRDVKFVESIFPFHKDSSCAYIQPTPVAMTNQHWHDDFLPVRDTASTFTEAADATAQIASSEQHDNSLTNTATPDSSSMPVRRSTRTSKRPMWHIDYVIASVHTRPMLYPIANQVCYKHLGKGFKAFLSSLDQQYDPIALKKQ